MQTLLQTKTVKMQYVASLIPLMTDLTQLSKRNKGQFSFWQGYRIIDGREEVKGHGTRDMPIWGDVFIRQEGDKLADETRAIGRILAIVYYLQSIQEK